MWLSFTRPELLLLLPVAGLLLWLSARVSFADLRGVRRRVAWGTRLALVLALVLAVAGAQLVRRSRGTVVVMALDLSHSVPPAETTRALDFGRRVIKERGPDDRVALVVFGRDATVESESLRTADDLRLQSHPAAIHTDIAAALRLSLGLVPPEVAGRVILLSDGNENTGSAEQEALLAEVRQVPIDVFPLGTRSTQDALVRAVTVPAAARRGETIPVRLALEASGPMASTVTVLIDGKPGPRRSVTLGGGATTLEVPVTLEEPGFHRIDALLEAPGEGCRENDRGTGFVRVAGKPRVLMVDSSPGDLGALRRAVDLQDIVVEAGGAAKLPTNSADLERYDGVVLSNYPAYGLAERQMVMLREGTRSHGIGLGMIGGDQAFGAGGYYRSALEEALPVSMDVNRNRAFPASATVIVVDSSGSMGATEDGVEKIQLAAEAAVTVVDLLRPYDSIGVIASDPSPTVVCPLRRAESKSAINSDIRSLRAGGGGVCVYSSLDAAREMVSRDRSPIRHIILLADGGDCDEPEGSVALARRMAGERITVSTVAFGEGKDVGFLREVAAAGGGESYLTGSAHDLKKIFTREALIVTKSVLVEETFRARVSERSALARGFDWASAPPLLGYVVTSRKPLATTALVTHKDDPLLAHWQYGLGRSFAFTSDAHARWAPYWLNWSEFGKFWGQTLRWSLREPASPLLHPRVERESDRARLVVEAAGADGASLNGLELRASVSMPAGGRQELALDQAGPGRYETSFEAAATGPYVIGIDASGPEGFRARQTTGFAVAYPPDFADTRPNDALLKSLAQRTGGTYGIAPRGAFAPPAHSPHIPRDISRALLWLAVLLLPLDVAVRRLAIGREELVALGQGVRLFLGRWGASSRRPAPATLAHALIEKRRERPARPSVPLPPPVPPAASQQPERPPAPGPEPGLPTSPAPTAAPDALSPDRTESTTAHLLERARKRRERGR